uniref:Reverse transcriptase domain-containing protein n=1 Tax=Angiostrongylus cantonensis TaxID=6313 RepID=A0A0K0CZH9_ANGCA
MFKKGDNHDIGNNRPVFMLSAVYKLFARVILNKIDRTLDEGQQCKQAGLRKRFSTMDQIHMITRLTEVLRKYKRPLCLTFIDLRAFDSIEIEAVMETLDSENT